jgi:hypothetical protein
MTDAPMSVIKINSSTRPTYKRPPRDLVRVNKASGPGRRYYPRMTADIQSDLGGK